MMRKTLALAVVMVGCVAGKPAQEAPDFGTEDGKDDSARYPGATIHVDYGQTVDCTLGSGVNWRAFEFRGNQGQFIDARAQGLDDTDTVLYIYKVSRYTGRPYGRALAYNDDDENGGWSLRKAQWNPYSSSITGVELPESRDYAAVLTTYHQQGGHALVQVSSAGAIYPATPPAFRGSSGYSWMHFVDGTTPVLDAKMYAPSIEIQTALHDSASLVAAAAIYQADPSALASALADSTKSGDLAYGFLLSDANTNSYDASWTPVDASNAVSDLMQAAMPEGDAGLEALVTYVLGSMFADSAFRASDVDVYRIHWDNGDDTNAEGIAAVKTSTGEVRVLSLDNPP